MKTLIVEDDITCRMVMQRMLERFGPCDVAVNGEEAVAAFRISIENRVPYDLVCLDIMMPGMDGHEALRRIRALETQAGILGLDGVKVIMTTALGDPKTIMQAFKEQCEAYLVKPVEQDKLVKALRQMRLISDDAGGQ